MVRATFDALKNQESPRAIAAKRGKKVSEIFAAVRRPLPVYDVDVDVNGGDEAVEVVAEA